MSKLMLTAPLQGWVAPLSEVPDAVFAERMLGDGVAIDPVLGELFAPCDGEIVSVAKTHHALTVRAPNGADILLHVGLDTVALGGRGFELEVEEGARVQRGQRLLRFDLDLLAREAKSLLTPIVVTNGASFGIEAARRDCLVNPGDALFELVRTAPIAATHSIADPAAEAFREQVRVGHAHGIHARPAALIAAALRATTAEVRVHAHGRAANARSAIALMGLGIRAGEVVTVAATGENARAAIAAIIPLLAAEHQVATPVRGASERAPIAFKPPQRLLSDPIRGVIASRGFAIGRAVQLHTPDIAVSEAGRDIDYEQAELDRARSAVRTHLQRVAQTASRTAREVLDAHIEFVDDLELVEGARRWIQCGKSAGYAWRRATRESADTLRALNDARMAERVADLLDVESQVLHALSGAALHALHALPERAILVADEIKPSQLVSLDATRLVGLCTARGGPTSHVAILAASMGIPALAAAGADVLNIPEQSWLVLDAQLGYVRVLEDEQERLTLERTLAERLEQQQTQRAAAQHECRTVDGVHIEVLANLAAVADAQYAIAQGAEGCGLLRTEFLFLDRDTPPDEQEQHQCYLRIAAALGARPLTIRTLDIGGDKPVPYLALPQEANPALGLRGVRTSLWRADLLRVQLRAILRVEPATGVRILIPMVTDVGEIRAVRAIIEELRAELRHPAAIPVGAMIETPASALLASELGQCVDFFSIGTNDLTQYVLAMDREHSDLAARNDGLHPAVLRTIGMVVESAARCKRPVAVCGGLASDPAAVPILLGLGIRELSAVPAMIPQLKAMIRTLTLEACLGLARRALQASSAEEVRALPIRSSV